MSSIPCDLNIIRVGHNETATKVIAVFYLSNSRSTRSTIHFMCDLHGSRQEMEATYDPAFYAFKARELTGDHEYIRGY